jgi:hypothetical protein
VTTQSLSLTSMISASLFLRHCEEPTGPAFDGPDDKLSDEAIHGYGICAIDCFAEPVIGRAFARSVGSR